MIRAYLFDLDGTLLDREHSLLRFIENQYDRLAPLHQVDRETYVNRFIALDNRGYTWKDKVYAQLAEEFGLSLGWEALLADYERHFHRFCVGFPGLHEMLRDLRERGFALGMITNGLTDFQAGSIRALGIEPYFDAILISEAEGVRKPDPEIFRRALARLGVAAEEAVYVGDHPDNDVTASRRAGLRAIWKWDRYYANAAFERDGTIRELAELRMINFGSGSAGSGGAAPR